MRIFRPEVESVLKTLGVLSLVALVLAPIAWGYEQRRQARAWQSVACAYRLRDLAQRAPIIRVDYVADPAASCTVSASCSNRRAEGPDGDAILADAALSPDQHRGVREILAIAVLIDQATTFSPANVTRTDATVRLDPFYSDHDSARPGQPCAAQIRVARESRDQRRHL